MAIFDKLVAAFAAKDTAAYLENFADDAVFVRHQTGTEMSKAEFGDMIAKMMPSDGFSMSDRRCIYENDDILVMHSINDYPDGTREAVLLAANLEGGKIRRIETGATLLKS